ncbi:hypothetical protein GC105_12310 [Alkalibaculum sp. M08DMB]|uniref:DUF4342 domain-containing protein n=1 Tax=Alkalibaculum sporogenes TaxID=2655001 RepID=A0A6A7KBC5_9FIRM|nr:hypothetical protein [Alkalibaculum sporogenes]MPW26571.1 hypothetical protein [Alkalibaculum sporogenes]
MRVTLDQVETLRKRVSCDYQTAEKALRKSKGNIDGAVLYLKKMENRKFKKAFVVLEQIINRIFSYSLLIVKNDKNIFSFPIVLVIIVVWSLNIPLPIILSIGVLAALSEFSFEIIDRNSYKYEESFTKSEDKKSKSQNSKSQNSSDQMTDKKSDENNAIISQSDDVEKVNVNVINDEVLPIPQQKEPPLFTDDDGYNEIIIE